MKIHSIISRLKESENIVTVGDTNSSTCNNTTTESSPPKMRLEMFYEDELSLHNSNFDPISVQEVESIKQQLANLCNRPRVSISSNVLDIWKVLKKVFQNFIILPQQFYLLPLLKYPLKERSLHWQ